MSVQRMTEVQAREWKALLNAHAENQSLRVQLRSANEENKQLREAARWLLSLKDGPRDESYYLQKIKAWESLRAALASPQDERRRE